MFNDLIETFFLLLADGGSFVAGVFIFFIAGFLFYLLFLVHCLSSYWWPRAEGIITVSKLNISKQRSAGSGSHRTTVFEPIVKYEYQVNGKKYNSKKVRFFQLTTSSEKAAQNTVALFQKGSSVTVYHSSIWPSSSVLIPGLSIGAFFILFFFLISIWMMRFYVA